MGENSGRRSIPQLIGAHVSTAGGISKAPERGARHGCRAIQIFTKPPSRWKAPTLTDAECDAFRAALKRFDIGAVTSHDAYLTNLASPESALWKRSKSAFKSEVERCARLGIPSLVMHPGSHKGAGEAAGIRRVAQALGEILDATRDEGVEILIETTAGQGASLGCRFEHIAEILDRLDGHERLKVCFDTCHVFAAGYDLRRTASFEKVMKEFDRRVGLDRLSLFHLNDSKGGLGSRVDRHEHIGEGKIGLEPFRTIVRARRFRRIPKIIETPGGVEGGPEDRKNLELLFSFAGDG